jgi:two-component system NtrC family sensor kinase
MKPLLLNILHLNIFRFCFRPKNFSMFYFMKKIVFSVFLILLQNFCFGQTMMLDSLKLELKNAKSDTTKLKIYLALGKASDKKNKLMYAEPALQLVDKLLLNELNKRERKKLIEQEQALLSLIGIYYRRSSPAEWDKAMTYLQSRLQAIEKTGDQKRTAAFLYEMARISVNEKKDSVLFRTYMLRSISVAKVIKDSALIVEGNSFLTAVYWSAGNFSNALNAVQSSITICRQLGYEKGLAESHRLMAGIYEELGEEEQALENFQISLDIATKTRDTIELSTTLQAMGNFYSRKKNIDKALEFYKRLLAIINIYKIPNYSPGTVLMLIGNVYSENSDYKKALHYFEESLKQYEAEKDYERISISLFSIGIMYNKKEDFEKAIEYNTRAIQVTDSLNDPNQIKSYQIYLLAKDYYGLKNYAMAKELNDKAMVDFKRDWFDINGRVEMELLAMQIDSARGDGFGAFSHYKEYIRIKDKLKGDEIKKETLKIRFKSEMEKEKAEQEKKDAIAKRTRNLQYAAIGAMMLLGIFLFYGYIQKNKDNKKIQRAYSELKATQSQLIQSEKMASLGELTAGIAHEIQNPLNFVNNFSELSVELAQELKVERNKEKGKRDNDLENDLLNDLISNQEKINYHGKRASNIVKGMLEHSRTSTGQRELTDINTLCDEYLRLAYHGLRAREKSFNATLKTYFDESIDNINIIPQDMGRVMLNLITNAFYVVNEKSQQNIAGYEPTVELRTKKEGNKVMISIKDNGNGIPQKILDKIFHPFFTTKPTGQGTGLGLSLSYDIVKAHGGELKVETKEGEGSEFMIVLPV